MLQHSQRHYSEEDYFAVEASSGIKHEFYQGEIFALVGASLAHNHRGRSIGRSSILDRFFVRLITPATSVRITLNTVKGLAFRRDSSPTAGRRKVWLAEKAKQR